MHVLFVCTGNICRSPTAERLAIARATEAGIPDFEASSAGTRAVIGHPVHADAEHVLLALGGNPNNFAARHLTGKIASGADLILTMTRTHREAVLEIAPHRLSRTFTLLEAARLVTEQNARTLADLANLRPHIGANDAVDIDDPIGQSPEIFAAVGKQIAAALPPILELCRF
ncbi:low molecular weight phosphatase family protein [Mycolicibacterium sp. 22603]|uniref:arsenate reductase/protein-tyrosine-phosphatase family protein n=1 Tax=Mycolicibacterium sp. 22603 TaxID=3453950 RepID=UPI003F8591C1